MNGCASKAEGYDLISLEDKYPGGTRVSGLKEGDSICHTEDDRGITSIPSIVETLEQQSYYSRNTKTITNSPGDSDTIHTPHRWSL